MSSNSTGTATVPVKKEREDSTSPEQTTASETAYELRNLPIAAELRRLRGSMTLREVEGQTGIPNPYLSNLERGIRRPGFKILHQLASFYGVSHNHLLELAGLDYTGMADTVGLSEDDVERSYRFLLEDPAPEELPRTENAASPGRQTVPGPDVRADCRQKTAITGIMMIAKWRGL